MADIGEGAPELDDLIAVVENCWFEVARRWVEAGIVKGASWSSPMWWASDLDR